MLTRIEIDGFKTFEDFGLDLMPLTVITGPNAVGKSNLFDALRLLSRMVRMPDLAQAFAGLRGRASEQFREVAGEKPAARIRIAAECLLDREVEDAFNTVFTTGSRRLRYEIEVERRFDKESGIERLFVAREGATSIQRKDDGWLEVAAREFPWLKNTDLHGKRRSPFLETVLDEAVPVIRARQDGVQGRSRPLPAERATATYLSTVNDAKDFGHLFALKRALSDIVFLQADPAAEREPSDFNAPLELEPSGRNLAIVLHRIRSATASTIRPDGALADISADLASLVPGVARVTIRSNEEARQFELAAELRNGQSFSSRLLSDGTLRLLALVTVANDPDRPGTLCFEEPENGVSEARVQPLIELLRGACEDAEQRLFQVLMNSHSPRVLEALRENEAVFADLAAVTRTDGNLYRRTRMRSVVSGELFPQSLAAITLPEAKALLLRDERENA